VDWPSPVRIGRRADELFVTTGPLDTARDRCLWHAGGTAAEDNHGSHLAAIHPLRMIPAHSRLPKVAAKGSAQRCDGVTLSEEAGQGAGWVGCSMNQARPHVGPGREG
jgi:hypothetical protein